MLKRILFTTYYIIQNGTKRNSLKRIQDDINTYNIPNLESYVPQGICVIDDYTLITLYDGDKLLNSKIIILKDNSLIKTVYIDDKYHLGGICYDNINNIIWLTTTKGCISGYKKDDIFNANNEDTVKPIFNNIKLGDDFINIFNQNRIAYITYNNNKIYVGNYNSNNKSILKSFEINDDGSINLESVKVTNFIGYTQGITFYENNILVSSSWGRSCKSRLTILNDDNKKKVYYLPSMMEQITIKENKLHILFEVNAKKFNNKNHNRSDVIIININNFIK